jgi:hypothetical protein
VLPDGWRWVDPTDGARPWRAQRIGRVGALATGVDGLRVTIDTPSQESTAAWARVFEAGAAALHHPPRPGWAFNHHSGFVP